MKIWDRIMGRSVKDLAEEVDRAKEFLDQAEGRLAEQMGRVAAEQENVRLAQQDYDEAVAALVKEHPHLLGVTPSIKEVVVVQPDTEYEVVEVDDENDPRFTAGFSSVPTDDSTPLPPMEFQERDDDAV